MVLERAIKAKAIEKNPQYAFFLGAILALTGIIIGGIIFKNDASLAGILLITMAAVPVFSKIMKIEVNVDEKQHSVKKFFLRNEHLIAIFFWFYLGVAVVYGGLFRLLPADKAFLLFGKQIMVFSGLPNGGVTGYFFNSAAGSIITNNIYVILIAVFLSLLFGVGAILVLTWNASILGIFFATLGRGSIAYVPHTVLEFLAYFSAAIAGSLLSFAIMKEHYESEYFKNILKDSFVLIAFSILVVVVAAFIEVI